MCSGCESECKPQVRSCETEFQYAVKVVSGIVSPVVPGTPALPNPVAPGHYYTAINIHNPAKCGCVTFRVKRAVASPWENIDSRPGPVSGFVPIKLCADEAIELDNTVILGRRQFVKGYVVIESSKELDVVAVYTASQDFCGPCNSFYTERVPGRCVPVCEDLILPISTGIADWQTVSTPGGLPPGPVVDVIPNGAWAAAPSGSSWVSAAATDSGTGSSAGGPPGTYTYQLKFDLCSGFSDPVLQIDGLADNSATIALNGNTVVTVPDYTTITSGTALSGFQVGTNTLQVNLTNSSTSANPTGFAIAGLLRVVRGRCPCSKLPILLPPPLLTPILQTGAAGFAFDPEPTDQVKKG